MHISKSIYLYESIYLASLSFFEDVTNRFKASRRGKCSIVVFDSRRVYAPTRLASKPSFFPGAVVVCVAPAAPLQGRGACTASSVPSPRFLRLRRDVGLGDLSGCDVVFLGVICGGLSHGRIYTGWEVQASGFVSVYL